MARLPAFLDACEHRSTSEEQRILAERIGSILLDQIPHLLDEVTSIELANDFFDDRGVYSMIASLGEAGDHFHQHDDRALEHPHGDSNRARRPWVLFCCDVREYLRGRMGLSAQRAA